MSTTATSQPAKTPARVLIGRIAQVYLKPRWKGFALALAAAIVVAFSSAKQTMEVLKVSLDNLDELMKNEAAKNSRRGPAASSSCVAA